MVDIIGSLIFDSWTEPIPELRNSALEDRHLIYEGGGVILDLLLKQGGDGTCIHVGGQVLPDQESQSTVSDVPVRLECGSCRAYTRTNALGEFTFRATPNGTFNLTVILKNRRFIVRGLSNTEPRMWQVIPSVPAAGGR